MPTILIVDDELSIREMIRFSLTRNGFYVLDAENALKAKQVINKEQPDLMILDVMLPGQSGTDLARELRNKAKTKELPIIMLTAKDEEQDKIVGLELGADDYMTKPFSPAELIARINSLLRRVKIDNDDYNDNEYQFLDLRLNSDSHEVFYKHVKIQLSPIEFNLLAFFMSKPERIFSRSQLLDYVWGQESFIEERTVDAYIKRLRKSLRNIGYDSLIETIRGVGYRFSGKHLK